ncbi:MAG: MFS transporter [Candidatus Bathyarchaeia archaeon]
MFSLVNYLSVSVGINFFGENFVSTFTLVSSFLAGMFAIFGGLISDAIGRKRTTIIGFVLLGFGYALLGIYPQNMFAWYFYAVLDGVAWGIFYVIFFFTIWGELAGDRSSEKYYALGSLPYLFSTYLSLTISPFIAANVSFYAIFSFAAFFLFLAVVPLMFAPETLPENVLRERELRGYIERAKRVREKFTKG